MNKPFHSREPGLLIWESQKDDVRAYRTTDGKVRIEVPLGSSHIDLSIKQARGLGMKLKTFPRRLAEMEHRNGSR